MFWNCVWVVYWINLKGIEDNSMKRHNSASSSTRHSFLEAKPETSCWRKTLWHTDYCTTSEAAQTKQPRIPSQLYTIYTHIYIYLCTSIYNYIYILYIIVYIYIYIYIRWYQQRLSHQHEPHPTNHMTAHSCRRWSSMRNEHGKIKARALGMSFPDLSTPYPRTACDKAPNEGNGILIHPEGSTMVAQTWVCGHWPSCTGRKAWVEREHKRTYVTHAATVSKKTRKRVPETSRFSFTSNWPSGNHQQIPETRRVINKASRHLWIQIYFLWLIGLANVGHPGLLWREFICTAMLPMKPGVLQNLGSRWASKPSSLYNG